MDFFTLSKFRPKEEIFMFSIYAWLMASALRSLTCEWTLHPLSNILFWVFLRRNVFQNPRPWKTHPTPSKKNPTQSHYLNADVIAISRNFKQLWRTIHLIFFVVHTPESIYRPSWTEQRYYLCIVMASDSQIQKWWKIQIINTIQRLKPFLDTTVVFPVILNWRSKLIQSSRLYLQHFVRTHN